MKSVIVVLNLEPPCRIRLIMQPLRKYHERTLFLLRDVLSFKDSRESGHWIFEKLLITRDQCGGTNSSTWPEPLTDLENSSRLASSCYPYPHVRRRAASDHLSTFRLNSKNAMDTDVLFISEKIYSK